MADQWRTSQLLTWCFCSFLAFAQLHPTTIRQACCLTRDFALRALVEAIAEPQACHPACTVPWCCIEIPRKSMTTSIGKQKVIYCSPVTLNQHFVPHMTSCSGMQSTLVGLAATSSAPDKLSLNDFATACNKQKSLQCQQATPACGDPLASRTVV